MEARMIPYSVHLREDVYLKLKEVAKGRKAASLVRDAVTMIIEGDDTFNGGYNKAIRDVISMIQEDSWAKTIGIHDESLAHYLTSKVEQMLVTQKVNP